MSYEQALSVSQLNEYVKALIDSDELLQTAVVCGEISNFKNHYSTGHLYFSLKDEKSAVKCVMFSRDASRLKFVPENGMTVTIWGRVSVFPRDGAYQLYAGFMSPLGLGEQHAAFEMLKNKLMSEGLFDSARKKKLPAFPRKIGIVTSPTGAAVRDILNILQRRWPVAEIELYPALVQGAGAVNSLCKGLAYFNSKNDCDVIIIGRGGGSGEDLSAFNDESLARVIANSGVPVISAVGHETDVSISDFVADMRAPTPSAAAELAVPDVDEYKNYLSVLLGRARSIVVKNIEYYERRLNDLESSAVLSDPMRYIQARKNELSHLEKAIESAFRVVITNSEKQFAENVAKLEALNPLSVLTRGFAMVKKDDTTISSATCLSHGDNIVILFNDGTVDAVIK